MTNPQPACVRLAAGDAVVEIAPSVGGAIASFTLAGTDVLRPTPHDARAEGNVRSFACYPLVPYSNRIANARLAFDGREHALARNFGDSPHSIHGVGWQRAWSVVSSSDAGVQLALDHDALGDTAASWPWPFRVLQTFALERVGARGDAVGEARDRERGPERVPVRPGLASVLPEAAGHDACVRRDSCLGERPDADSRRARRRARRVALRSAAPARRRRARPRVRAVDRRRDDPLARTRSRTSRSTRTVRSTGSSCSSRRGATTSRSSR